jgi:EmrB/QacA subfamily drug resistance transporter
MAYIDSSAVNVALPSIARDLRVTAPDLQWVVEGYLLFLAALILLGGSLGDVYGRRRVFVIGIGLFALASLASAGAQTIWQLDLARCFQGVGGALATPGSLALISANFRGAEKGRAIGTWSAFGSITTAIGPLLGGWLAQYASWRYVFLINVPLAAAVIWISLVRVPESSDGDEHSIDLGGAAFATVSLALLTFGLIDIERGTTPAVVGRYIMLGVLFLIGFVAWERRASVPLMPISLFRSRAFNGANIYTFLLYAVLGGGIYFVTIDLQAVHAYTPIAAGAAMLPFITIIFVLSRWSGGLSGSIGPKIPLIAGAIIVGLAFVGFARIGVDGSYATTFLPAAVVLGFGGVLFVAPLTTTVMSAADIERAGIASGINNAVARCAGLFAIAVFGIVSVNAFYTTFDRSLLELPLAAQTRATLEREHAQLATGVAPVKVDSRDRARVARTIARAYTRGFKSVMLICAVLCWIAAVVALLTIPGKRFVRDPVT